MESTLKELRAAFEREPRIKQHQHPVHVQLSDGSVVLEGEVADVAAKRLALGLAGKLCNGAVCDRLRIATDDRGDGALRNAVIQALSEEPTLKNCGLRVKTKGQWERVREVQDRDCCGDLAVETENGTVTLEGTILSLSHSRLAEVLCWWAPGCRNVVNRLDIAPPMDDSDAEISDAVYLVLEKDRMIPDGQIHATSRDQVVTLEGLVFRPTEKQRAEMDVWCIPGVRDVVNHITVQK